MSDVEFFVMESGPPNNEDDLELLRRAGEHPIVRCFPHGALIVFDHDLRYLAAGGLGLADVGLSRESLEGKTIHDAFPPQVVQVIEPLYRAALRGDESTLDVPYGGRIYSQRLGPLRTRDGRIVAGMGFTQDVTETRAAQRTLEVSESLLREEHRRLSEAQEVGRTGSWEWDLITGILIWSDALLGLYGMDPLTFDGNYASALACIHPEDRAAVDAATESLSAGGALAVRYRVTRFDTGELRWFDARGRTLHADGVAVRLVGAITDVTELVAAQQEASTAQAFFNAALAVSPDLTIVTDLERGRILYASREHGVLGLSASDLAALGREDRLALVHPEDRDSLLATEVAAGGLQDGEVLQLRYRAKHGDGTWHWLNRRLTPFARDTDGKATQVLGVVRDVTDVVDAEDRLTRAALHDPLTGLPNRTLLLDRLDAAIARALREGRELAVLFCDLDGFKAINDTLGHAAGDAVLVEAARRLTDVLRDGDTVARIGGDEFVVLVEPWNRAPEQDGRKPVDTGSALATVVADRITSALRRPFFLDEGERRLTVSIGINHVNASVNRAKAPSAVQLLKDADMAMYRAKQLGKNRTEIY